MNKYKSYNKKGGKALSTGTRACVFSELNMIGRNKVIKVPHVNNKSLESELEYGKKIMEIPNWHKYFRPLEGAINIKQSNLKLSNNNREICKRFTNIRNKRMSGLMTIGGPTLLHF